MNVTYVLLCEECYQSYKTTLTDYSSDQLNLCPDCLEIENETLGQEIEDGQDSE